MEEYSGEYSDQGSHYEVESNSDLRVFGDPPPIAEKCRKHVGQQLSGAFFG